MIRDDGRVTAGAAIVAGGNLWSSGGMVRAYFDNWLSLGGLDVTYRPSGRIDRARLWGEEITPTSAGRIITAVQAVWIDLHTGHVAVYLDEKALVPIDPAPQEIRRHITEGVLRAVGLAAPTTG